MTHYTNTNNPIDFPKAERKLIGYTEREEGFYPLYAAQRGFITTAAFILCRYCRGAIDSMGGPRYDAVCLTCYEKVLYERRIERGI